MEVAVASGRTSVKASKTIFVGLDCKDEHGRYGMRDAITEVDNARFDLHL